jgi:uncharacterized protein YeaO (DUF488 family)
LRLTIKRVYEAPEDSDGTRILVDRLWPRGLSKEKARVDLWLKEIAPSTELRKWFGHDPQNWEKFRERYLQELKSNGEPLAILRQHMRQGHVTLLYAARDEAHNEAVILRDLLKS